MAQKLPPYNVLEMHSSLQYAGGGQRNLVTTAKYLNKELFRVFVGAYGQGGHLEKQLDTLGIEYIVAPYDLSSIKDFIKKNKIDIIHIHRSGGTVAFETALLRAVKEINPDIIIIEKNVFGLRDREAGSLIDVSFFQSMMHVHERYLKNTGQIFDFSKQKVMYNFVDGTELEKYRFTNTEIQSYISSLGLKPEHFIIGRIGRADISKWSDLFLDMMPQAIKLVPHVRALITGVPISRVKRIKNSWLDKYITIVPSITDDKHLHLLHQSFDVMVHTSKIGECNGNTINEAMFWAKPVITHSTPHRDNGQLEQVEHMRTGILANYPATMARAIEYLYQNPNECARMGNAGREKIIQNQIASEYIKNLEKSLVEIMLKKGLHVPPACVDLYSKIGYYPSEEAIKKYPIVYLSKLKDEYSKLTQLEKISWKLTYARRFYWKIRDSIEHRLKK